MKSTQIYYTATFQHFSLVIILVIIIVLYITCLVGLHMCVNVCVSVTLTLGYGKKERGARKASAGN